MSGLGWWLLPLLPLLCWLLILRWPTLRRLLWLVPLTAVWFFWQTPPAISSQLLWPGASLGLGSVINQYFLLLTGLLWSAASAYAAITEARHPRQQRFWSFWLWALSGNLLLIIAQDAASFYIGFTLMSLAAYGLIAHAAGPLPRQAARLYLQLAILGEMLIYAGLMLRIHETGGLLNFADWQQPPGGLTTSLLLIGFGLKAGFWPLHIWLPLAHPVAPAAASAVLSGAMLKAGILGIWQFLPATAIDSQTWGLWLFATGMISAFYAVLAGIMQRKAKSVLAFSSVSQMGYLLMIIGLTWLPGSDRASLTLLLALYAVHHAVAKAALFMGAGLASGSRLAGWHGLILLIPALALVGLPLSSGAVVKLLLKDSVNNSLLAFSVPLLSLGALATALLLGRALWLMYQTQQQARQQRLGTAAKPQQLAWLLLSLLPVLLPLVLPEFRERLLQQSVSDQLSLLWPLLVASLICLWLLRSGRRWPLPSPGGPARLWSLKLRYCLLHLPLPQLSYKPQPGRRWRQLERRLNRIGAAETVSLGLLMAVSCLLLWALFV